VIRQIMIDILTRCMKMFKNKISEMRVMSITVSFLSVNQIL
jgi:hypothetical protein